MFANCPNETIGCAATLKNDNAIMCVLVYDVESTIYINNQRFTITNVGRDAFSLNSFSEYNFTAGLGYECVMLMLFITTASHS